MAQLGELYLRQGRVRLARALLERSMRSCQELGERIGQAEALSRLGMLHLDQARYGQATACLQEAAAMWKLIGRRLRLAQVLVGLGDAHEAAGDPAAARATWSEALALFRQFELPQPAALTQRLGEPAGPADRQPMWPAL